MLIQSRIVLLLGLIQNTEIEVIIFGIFKNVFNLRLLRFRTNDGINHILDDKIYFHVNQMLNKFQLHCQRLRLLRIQMDLLRKMVNL